MATPMNGLWNVRMGKDAIEGASFGSTIAIKLV